MMAVLYPCFHCHRKDGCAIKKETLERLRGLKISKANLRCPIPQQDFPPGTTVDVAAFILTEGGYDDYGYRKSAVVRRGVVAGWHAGKCSVALNKDQEIEMPEDGAIGYLKVTTDRLKRVDEPVQEICGCGLPQSRCENSDYPSIRTGEWSCWQYQRDGNGSFYL